MVATLLKLKLRLFLNGLKRSTAQLVATIIGLVFVVMGGAGLLLAGFGASFGTTDNLPLVASLVILVGAVVLLMWTVVPPLFFGVDPTLDPQRFATLNVPPRALSVGLLLAGFIGLPGLMTVCFSAATVLVWLRQPAALLPALVGAAIGALMAIGFSRLVTAAMAGALASRRGRDLAGMGSVLLIVVASLGVQTVSNSMGAMADHGSLGAAAHSVHTLATWAQWTPFGAPWAIGPAAAAGNWGLALALLVVACAYLGGLVWLWSIALKRSIVRPPSASGSKAREDNLVLSFARRVSRPTLRPVAAMTARCWRYWTSDPRYLVSFLLMPLMAVMMIVMSFVMPDARVVAAFGPIFMGFVTGMMLSNDTGFDSTAFWINVFAPVRGRTDRASRLIAVTAWVVPMLAVAIVVCVWIGRVAEQWPAVTGISVALAFGGLGAGLVSSALATTPCPLPGESPMASKSGSSALKMAVGFGVMGVCLLVATPSIVFGVLSFVSSPAWGWLSLALGVILGAAAAVVGVFAGGSILDRRKLSLLSQLVAQDS